MVLRSFESRLTPMRMFSTILSSDCEQKPCDWRHFYTCMKREREIEREIEEMTRVEARKRSLIFPQVLFNFPSLPFAYECTCGVRQYIHDACSLYPGKYSSPRRQFLQFINVYISAFNVTTRTFYDTEDSEMNLSWCILNPPRLLLLRKGWMLYDVINL